MLNRSLALAQLRSEGNLWDITVIGGGATGIGIALDAASRGYRVCLFEQSDFGKGTSSRSTKLVHGGVRYLAQGRFGLVHDALVERHILLQNAPQLVHKLPFVVPAYAWWEKPYYAVGLKLYDMLAGRYGLGRSTPITSQQALAHAPSLKRLNLRGGVCYFDGQFDDARLLIAMAQTAVRHGACLLNYTRATAITKTAAGKVTGVVVEDVETGNQYPVASRCTINATGAFSDAVRQMNDSKADRLIRPSQGAHIVLPPEFLPGDAAIVIPQTSDGRVLFAIPWHGRVLVGTTDTPVRQATLEPLAMSAEVDFILETASRYMEKPPTRSDILSVFAGIRPLIKADASSKTSAMSRDHRIIVDDSGLITIAGGKWTTYRRMAEQCVDRAAAITRLPARACVTRDLRIHAADSHEATAMAEMIQSRPELGRPLHRDLDLSEADVVWAARNEMARTIEDVLSRRSRALLLDARAAIEAAPAVARLLAEELGRGVKWEENELAEFKRLAQGYLVESLR